MLKSCLSILLLLVVGGKATQEVTGLRTTCGDLKAVYKKETCCAQPEKEVDFQVVPDPSKSLYLSSNQCDGKKPKAGTGFDNIDCFVNGVVNVVEQAGGDVTAGYEGGLNASGRVPITKRFFESTPPLCPVNVHWHLGAEHRSQGQYDENGKGPLKSGTPATGGRRLVDDATGRLLASDSVRYGFACNKYDPIDPKFTTPYHWQHCVGMIVGETYEVHWPHSAIGACHTPYQYQTPFYDGVFCGWTDAVAQAVAADAQNLVNHVGVQAQVFTIVNDESYYYPDLMRGAIVDGEFWSDVAAYTGSTTGTTRNNQQCSTYTPITWQVDRKCHLISASTFDKMCADMKQQADDLSGDLYPHGARELVDQSLTANNLNQAASNTLPSR